MHNFYIVTDLSLYNILLMQHGVISNENVMLIQHNVDVIQYKYNVHKMQKIHIFVQLNVNTMPLESITI